MVESPVMETIRYSQALRTIGQALEVLHIEAFDLEKEDGSYVVHYKSERPIQESLSQGGIPDSVVQIVWGSAPARPPDQTDTLKKGASLVNLDLRYTPEDIERLERDGQARRCSTGGKPDGHSISQLLRAVGGYVNKRDARLLGISLRDQSINIVYETTQGRRELDVLRLDSMYDFWLQMCLRRAEVTS